MIINIEEQQYIDIMRKILETGSRTATRTGIDALVIPHTSMTFDLSKGFPLFTHKKMAQKMFKVELEGFIKGIRSKAWFKERGCNIWNEWCNPQIVPYGNDEATKKKMLEEDDLGKIYGVQWRDFNGEGFDQLKWIIDQLKNNPTNRKLVCSAWNPNQMREQALEPCHVMWHVFIDNDKIHLSWFQRSCDFPLGISANVMSYSLLLHLLCKETGYKEGQVTGFFSNCHIYVNQIDGVKEALERPLYQFPTIKTEKFTSIFEWEAKDTEILDYKCGDKISYPIAV